MCKYLFLQVDLEAFTFITVTAMPTEACFVFVVVFFSPEDLRSEVMGDE